jgi:uncharacterized protein (DUF433 family)
MSFPHPTWTPWRIGELCERYGSGETIDAIAESWGITRNMVYGKWNRLKIPTKDWRPEGDDRACEMISNGKTFDEVADFMGVPAEAVAARFAVIRRTIGEQAR